MYSIFNTLVSEGGIIYLNSKFVHMFVFSDERSEELRKVHESKLLYLNKTQTDKVCE